MHTVIGVAVCWKVQIKPAIASDSTYGEIICMYKYVKKKTLSGDTWKPQHSTQVNLHHMCCIYVVEAKRVTPKVKHIDIPVCFLQQQFYKGFFIPKYEKSSVMLEDMCIKPCSGPIISRINKLMTGFRFYPTGETEHNQFMRLHKFIVK